MTDTSGVDARADAGPDSGFVPPGALPDSGRGLEQTGPDQGPTGPDQAPTGPDQLPSPPMVDGLWGQALKSLRPPPAQYHEPYIFGGPRHHTEWGRPDRILEAARRYPGVSPGPHMPQARDVRGLLQQVLGGLARFGSPGIAALAMNGMRLNGRFLKDFIAGREAGLKLLDQQSARNREQLDDAQAKELTDYREAWSQLDTDNKNWNSVKRQMLDVANKQHPPDQRMIDALGSDDPRRVEALLRVRDQMWSNHGRYKSQVDKQGEADRKAADREKEIRRLSGEGETPSSPATPTTTGAAPAAPASPAAAAGPAAPATSETPGATSAAPSATGAALAAPARKRAPVDNYADMYLNGFPDSAVYKGVKVGSPLAEAIQRRIDQRMVEEGIGAPEIARRRQLYAGGLSGAQTTGRMESRITSASNEVATLIPQARDSAQRMKQDRDFRWTAINSLVNEWAAGTSDPRYYDFASKNSSLLRAWVRAMNPQGVPRVTEQLMAKQERMLSQVTSYEAYEAMLRALWSEVQSSREAVELTKEGRAPPNPFPDTAAPGGASKDAAAREWLKNNPDDPRAAAIRKALGM